MVDPHTDLTRECSALYVFRANDGAHHRAVEVMTELGIRFSVYDNDVLESLCNSVTLQHLCLS
jgi:hypothetical protein